MSGIDRIRIASCLFAFLLCSNLAMAGFDYGDALAKTLLFFEAQRSGKLPPNQRVKWRGDSGLQDGFAQGVDLVGGYYDAGDHVKYGFPMAFTITILAWSVVEYAAELAAAGQFNYALDAVRWGTDYFIKCHNQPNSLWAQVGDGNSDHYCWQRPEDMTTPRTAFKIDLGHPGSDLAGETAAALAAASLAFKTIDPQYSSLLLFHASQLFAFADGFRGRYDDSVTVAKEFYPSSGYNDELLWAAAWLFTATNNTYYLKYAVDNAAPMGGTTIGATEFSWDNKYAGLQILMSKVAMEGNGGPYDDTLQQYRAKADYFICACLQKNAGYNVAKTPGGLLYVREWNNMQYASLAAFLLTVYSGYLNATNAQLHCPDATLQPVDLLKYAQTQADYMLGKNPKYMSYLVGFGNYFPTHVHHRGASILAINILSTVVSCLEGFEMWFKRFAADPNVLIGALVGGPDVKDNYIDLRTNYDQTEPTITNGAPLVGLFAKLNGSASVLPP